MNDTDRQIETASAIARIEVSVEGINEKVAGGFDRTNAALERVGTILDRHDRQLERISAREARISAAGKWLAGVVSAVVVTALAMVLGLKR